VDKGQEEGELLNTQDRYPDLPLSLQARFASLDYSREGVNNFR